MSVVDGIDAPLTETDVLPRIALIVGSIRSTRRAGAVARWAHEHASGRTDAEFSVVDLAQVNLPRFDQPSPPSMGQLVGEEAPRWARTIAGFDGFIFVTPEYNRSIPGPLKDALDYLYTEWRDKAAGFVSYGLDGGVRAVEHLRLIGAELGIADVSSQVAISLADINREGVTVGRHEGQLDAMLDELVDWTTALRSMRLRRAMSTAAAVA